jgi:CIC family chloride channel protein
LGGFSRHRPPGSAFNSGYHVGLVKAAAGWYTAVVQLLTNKRVAAIHAFLHRHWQRLLRIRGRVRFSEEAFHLMLAGGVGVIGGVVNLFFYYATESVKLLFLGRPGDIAEVAEMMSKVDRLVIPTAGGLCAGIILYWGRRLLGRQGSSNLLEAVVAGDGRLPFRDGLVKFASALMTIGTGGSIGREGGIVHLSATLASKCGQVAKWPPYRLRLLVGCGAASGIAAAYNAPISGAVFASWIVLGSFSMSLFAPLVFSSVVATMVSRTFFGIRPWYSIPPFDFTSVGQLPWFVLLGIACGAMGAVFLKMLRYCEEVSGKLRLPVYARLGLGGLVVGVIAVKFPGVWGNGYAATNGILHQEFMNMEFPVLFLGGLFLAKLLATLATVGSGAVGGVFTPTLFLGAGLGALFGMGLQVLGGAAGLPIAVFAVVGMGSMLSATTRSPLLAMIMVFEISLDYSLMPPLMLGCVVSTLVASRLHSDSVYTEPLRRRGLSVSPESNQQGAATERTVGDVMHAPVSPIRESAPLSEIADRFLTSPNNFLPVVDARRRLVGLVALQDLKEYLNAGSELKAVIAYDVMRPPPICVTPGQHLLEVLPVVLASEQRHIPVVNTLQENRLIGALARAEVLDLFSEAIAASGRGAG